MPIFECDICRTTGDSRDFNKIHNLDLCIDCYKKYSTYDHDRFQDLSKLTNEERAREYEESQKRPKVEIESIILTTAPWLEGYRVIETLEIITAECVYGMNLFRDFFASVTDVIGGRSNATQTVLRDARRTCLSELKLEAHYIGANAVIAVDLDYSEFSGQNKSMLFLVASGTAVRVEKLPEAALMNAGAN